MKKSSGTTRPDCFDKTDFYKKIEFLCRENFSVLAGKGRLSDLDQYKWENSAEYQNDIKRVQKLRNTKYGIIVPIYESLAFSEGVRRDGFSFAFWHTTCDNTINVNPYIKDNFLIGSKLLFPVKSDVIKKVANGFVNVNFNYNNIEVLEKIQEHFYNKSLGLLFIFTPSINPVCDYGYYVNPIALYLVDRETKETIANLSSFIRKYNPNIDNKNLINAKKHFIEVNSLKSQHYCSMCGGKGYKTGVNMGGIKGKTTEKCITCGGTGYVYY